MQEVLRDPAFRAASAALADPYRTRLVRQVLDRHRQALRAEAGGAPAGGAAGVATAVIADCVEAAAALARPFPRRVVNGTGVLIHTNLGRAPLGELGGQLGGELGGEFAAGAPAGYTDLEWDAASQGRGDRDLALGRQLRLLTGAEAAVVVNNCAGALLLALNTLAAGRGVVVSRAELVEIGGSFRVPDVMAASGCRLREVGTTNRTRPDDYERGALGPEGPAAALLKVHQSNFVQRGFVAQVDAAELVALGRRLGVPVVEDNGSGLLAADAPAAAEGHGGAPVLRGEPRVAASLAAGVDVVCCSGDKLLGGVQAGLLLGRADLVGAMRRNPLFRALRLDKVRAALLGRTLRAHLAGRAAELPVWRLFHASLDELGARLDALRLPGAGTRWRSCRRVPLRATLGGGSNPEADFPSLGLELAHRDLSADAVRRRLAAREVPIAAYVRRDRCYLDARTLFADDLPEVQRALDELGAPDAAGGAPLGTPRV